MGKIKPSIKLFAAILVIIAVFICVAVFGIGDRVKGVGEMRFGIDIRGGVEAVFEPKDLNRKPEKNELETARTVIESRLDANNITDREVTADRIGGYIIVRFPWKSDEKEFNPEEAIAELGEMAKLTFRDADGNVRLEGKNVKSAVAQNDPDDLSSGYVVALTFDAHGAKLFSDVTEELTGQQMGIYMDEELISNPMVETKIEGGEAVINGMETFEEAKELADKINAGALPFSLETTNFSTISPTLGANALNIMVIAGILALAAVCAFMLFYYKLPGAVACVTLIFQMTLQLLAISVPQYTLTLPGIAGIILSLGMAVDANIIISERISEELLALRTESGGRAYGRSVIRAVKAGYKNAFSSVIDGNITTAIVAVILMIFGSGSMLSFGYTLIIGMIVNVFAGVSVSKHLLLSLLEKDRFQSGRCFRRKKEKKYLCFFQRKWIFGILTAGVLLIGALGIGIRGVSLDTQFTGGAVLGFTTGGEADTDAVETAVAKITDRPVTVQITDNRQTGDTRLVVTLAGTGGMSPEEQGKIAEAVGGDIVESYVVEPYIGARALKNSVIAMGLSFLFIVVYVWIRFKNISGLSAGAAALIALFHDTAVVFFVFVVFEIPLNDAFVAVVLTIIGYSINDTIVVFDRIRENRGNEPSAGITELIDKSISQVLSRSVNTSLTTGVCVLIILGASIVFGIRSIYQFSLPMFFGIISGCYSSVCIAGVLWGMWERRKEGGK